MFLLKYKNYQFRLPTEAEWEYAARSGGKKHKYSWTDDAESLLIRGRENEKDLLKRFAFFGNTDGTQPVGQLYPNSLGIYDMSGNVWEWCQDWAADYFSKSVINPQGPNGSPFRVLRGGSCGYDALRCRVSYRFGSYPDDRFGNYGFRLLLSSQKNDEE